MKADLVDDYLLVDADDREALRAELAAKGIPFTEGPPFRIDLNGHNTHAVLKAIDTPLTTVTTHTPSLEEAYLEILEQS